MCANNLMMSVILAILASFGLSVFVVQSNPVRPEEPIGISEISGEILPPFIIENVSSRGGLEIFAEPDRANGGEFAAGANFQPHVAGINAEGDWLYIYYFDEGELTAGWSPLNQMVLNVDEIASLSIIDPENLPELPDLPYNDLAARPYGTNAPVESTSESATAMPESGDGGDNSAPASGPPPTNGSGT